MHYDFLTQVRPWPQNFTYFPKNNILNWSFWKRKERAFKLYMFITCEKTFLNISWLLTLWLWPRSLTYFSKILYCIYNFWFKRDRTFIFDMYITCNKMIQSILWFFPFDPIFKNWYMIGVHIWHTICHKLWYLIH